MKKNLLKKIKNEKVLEIILALLLIVVAVILRLLPHPPNFSPLAAMALFGGVYLGRKLTFLIPFTALFISDCFLGLYDWKLMTSVYFSFLLVGLLGLWLKNHKKNVMIFGAGIASSLLFFLITNFSVWLFTSWYPKTLTGLEECFLLALPFLKNTLFGDLFYLVVFFGTYEVISIALKRKLNFLPKIIS